MSEPVSKIEIEDVLSSIRRLVSEESRIEPRRVKSREPSERNRLVLTPALRVAQPPRSESPQKVAPEALVPENEIAAHGDPEAGFDGSPDSETGFEEDRVPGDDQVDVDNDAGVTDTDATAEGSEPWRDPGATLFATAREVTEDDRSDDDRCDDGGPDGEESADDVDGDDVPEPGAEPQAVSENPAPTGPADAEDWMPEDPEPGDGHAEDNLDPADWSEDIDPSDNGADGDMRDAYETGEPGGETAGDAGDDEDELADTARSATLSAKIEALEAAIGRTHDQWEPDGAGVDDYAGTPVQTIEWEDHADPASQPPEPTRAAADTDNSPDKADLFPADEAFLDEESLRELVADIVREELQGALGERITRNVRKLVRREIHRALTAQELE